MPGVILLPENPLTMTLYLSYPMATMVRMEQTPVMAPVAPYSWQPNFPHIQNLWLKALMITGQAWVSIMQKSDRARFTTNMLEGVRRDFT